MAEYGYTAQGQQLNMLFGALPVPGQYAYGNTITTSLLSCCGLVGISNMHQQFRDPAEHCKYVAALYRDLKVYGMMIYCITNEQEVSSKEHAIFLKMGTAKIADFLNLAHGPNRVQLWLVNIRDAVGVYCDEKGEAYTTPKERAKPEKARRIPIKSADQIAATTTAKRFQP